MCGLSEIIMSACQAEMGSLLLLLSRFSRVRLCATPWTAAHQAPPSMGFSRQKHWSGYTTQSNLWIQCNPYQTTCLLRNLYAGQEATVRTRYGTIDCFKIGKGVCQGSILSPCLCLYAEYIMWNAGLGVVQAGIRIARRNISNFRYTDDTTLMAESKEELKGLLM